jgi:NTE family protein
MKKLSLFMKKLYIVVILLTLTTVLFSQNKRPKIGLVLSGGGAKGIAHIGVLKAMEKAGLTPDYITGTSMGSLIGALYSIGYTADELEQIVSSADWDLLLTNNTPLNQVAFEEKYYYGRYLLDFYVQNKKLKLPKGIIEGQALMELFSKLTRPVHGINDFNKFPVPFACVATDIVTGKPVVLNKGSLAMSMRASMSIPTVFNPVKIDGHLLVDGGLVRNMPVDEVIDMGADIVIGVFVGYNFISEDKLNSAVSILSQSAFVTSVFDSRKQMSQCDILVKPNLEGLSSGSFHSTPEILKRGYVAGDEYVDVFKNLADSLRKMGDLHKIVKPQVPDSYTFSDIDVIGNKIIQDEFIIGKLGIKINKPISIEKIDDQISLMYGTQYFEKIWYEIINNNDSYTLRIHIAERPKTELRFAYHYDTENKGGIIGNITLRNLLFNRSKLIFEANMATYPSLLLDYFKYVGKKQNFAFGVKSVYTKNDLPFYDSVGHVTDIFYSDYGLVAFKLQLTKVKNSTLGIETLWNIAKLKPRVTGGDFRMITKIEYDNILFKGFYRYNNYNERYFPTKGVKADIDISTTSRINGKLVILDTIIVKNDDILLQTTPITSLNIKVAPVIQIHKKVSLLFKTRIKLSTIEKNTLNLTEYDFVGGFAPGLLNSQEYMGVGVKEYMLANYFYGNIGVQYSPVRNLYCQAHFNYIDSEYPVKWINPDANIDVLGDRDRRFSYGVSVGYKSPIGPISIAVAKDHYRSGLKASFMIGFHY